jgi:hypothetical protein
LVGVFLPSFSFRQLGVREIVVQASCLHPSCCPMRHRHRINLRKIRPDASVDSWRRQDACTTMPPVCLCLLLFSKSEGRRTEPWKPPMHFRRVQHHPFGVAMLPFFIHNGGRGRSEAQSEIEMRSLNYSRASGVAPPSVGVAMLPFFMHNVGRGRSEAQSEL